MNVLTAKRLQWRSQALEEQTRLRECVHQAYGALASPSTGIIQSLFEPKTYITYSPIRIYTAIVNNLSRYGVHARIDQSWCGGAGAGLSLHEAIMAAMGEAVERYAACMYDEKKDIVWASYNEVQGEAICPTRFALPSSQDQQRYSEQLARFDADAPIGWTRGWLLPDASTVLVPACLVYAYHYRSFSERLTPGISTGLAAGPDMLSATLRGICECVERDAFMISYLNRLPVPEIDLTTVRDASVQDLLLRTRPWSNCSIRAWNITSDIRIPTVLAVITGSQASMPAISCGAATHVSPARALQKALVEAWQCHVWLSDKVYMTEERRHQQFATDFHDVLTRDDHLTLAAQSQYKMYLDWLLQPRSVVPLESLPDLSSTITEQELANVVQAVQRVGLPIVACDITPQDIEDARFSVSRVLIPGTQPITFGPILPVSERLFEVPQRLGYTTERTRWEDLNPVPHPFP